jgi:hypothetical protein
MKRTVDVKRGVSNSVVSDMQSEMKSIRKEMKLLRSENMSLRANNMMLHHNVKSLIEKVNSLEEREDELLERDGKDPPGSFDNDHLSSCESDKENAVADEECVEQVQTVNNETGAAKSPQKSLGYRTRIRSRMSYSPKKEEDDDVISEPEKTYLGLTGRRSQIYKEINRIKSSPVRDLKDKDRVQTMNL